jgi:putative Ca2+/H+ antiporter (TMEM165/GDT1 family)
LHVFLTATGVVALAEIGDKTQLLALLLAAKFRRPLPIIGGIVMATLANHLLAGLAGVWLTQWLAPGVLRWILGLGFLAMAAWTLVPDEDGPMPERAGLGAFATTVVAFFLAEIGDKTQIATVMLAARYHDLLAVVAGTTCGMLLADVPAVLLGERLTRALPVALVRRIAAVLFATLGIATLLGAGSIFGL